VSSDLYSLLFAKGAPIRKSGNQYELKWIGLEPEVMGHRGPREARQSE